jgi:hypothetical protein
MSKLPSVPGEPPAGFLYHIGKETGMQWVLAPDEYGPVEYQILVDGAYHCGYFERESAEYFLPHYQRDFPKATVTIRERPRGSACKDTPP